MATAALAFLPHGFALAETLDPASSPEQRLERGRAIAFGRADGNCLACHAIADGQLAGNIGPPLFGMKLRFPDKDLLREQIWDATRRNPETIMPPFGKHRILTDEEVDLVIEYLYSL